MLLNKRCDFRVHYSTALLNKKELTKPIRIISLSKMKILIDFKICFFMLIFCTIKLDTTNDGFCHFNITFYNAENEFIYTEFTSIKKQTI